MSGGQSRRNGAGARSPGAGLVPPGARKGVWVRLGRPANDNRRPARKLIALIARRLVLPGLLLAGAWALYRLL
ncbi:hypothetical protein [Zavarzinia compransoris]|uniref:Uncharacterized protein n=1 Tax=Zavarzinia compransoris TaxID=1264899 RepID=A0A317E9M2_9PROT|nr:hypothetical protein [Zavarzinia compransoris]PWR23827.1 hypothetical protein DKG75_04515 [Zavarzinia compransoris]TDP48062.1 hypothetical protein DES42_102359 [Zavarzinia compransoris]